MSETTEVIKRLRGRGLSQSEISRRTGIPQPRLSRWEGGEVPDAADDALKLRALDESLPPEPAQAPSAPTPSEHAQARRSRGERPSIHREPKGGR